MRNLSFTYKGKAIDVKQVGRELGVRSCFKFRKSGDRLRITGLLMDTTTKARISGPIVSTARWRASSTSRMR